MQKSVKTNVALHAAIEALTRAVNRFKLESSGDINVGDARMLRECAAVIARCSTDEVLTALKGIKSVIEV